MEERSYLKKIDEYRDEMVRTLQELVAINSVQTEPEKDMPFGAGVQKAFEYMLSQGEKAGFSTCNVDNYGGHIEFSGRQADETGDLTQPCTETMAILGHLDTVPLGADWDHDPLGGEIEDGVMYGRGTSDDKGPLIAAFYAMKAIADSGYVPQKNVRMILGLDEETDWHGMDHYMERVPAPDFGFTPDGDFPAVQGEMGILVFELARKFSKQAKQAGGITFRSMKGGSAPNMVADAARLLITADSYEDVKEKLEQFKKETGYAISAKGRGKSLEIEAQGVSAHGAMPWKGLNAISVLMKFAGLLPFNNEDVRDFIEFYNTAIGFELSGDSIGCGLADEPSGKLVFNVGMVEMDEEAVRLTVNVRYPVTLSGERVYDAMRPRLDEYDLGVVKLKHQEPIYMEPDSEMLQTLMAAYRRHTGDTESKPIIMGGGSYARAMQNCVCFGMLFPGELDTMHQKNERVSIDSLVKAAKIYADAIVDLTNAVPAAEQAVPAAGQDVKAGK